MNNNPNNLNNNNLSVASTVILNPENPEIHENQDHPFTERQQYLMKIMIEKILDDREKRGEDQVSGGGRRNKNKKSQRKSKKTQKKSKKQNKKSNKKQNRK